MNVFSPDNNSVFEFMLAAGCIEALLFVRHVMKYVGMNFPDEMKHAKLAKRLYLPICITRMSSDVLAVIQQSKYF